MSQVALLLERLSALLQQSVRDEAARHGLLPIHIQVLHYLSRANRYSDMPIAIAEYFGITRGTVSQTLAVLERRGLLTKRADPGHGRRVHLRLTAAGRAVVKDSWPERVEAAARRLGSNAPLLEATLRQLLSALQEVNGQRAFGLCRECAHFLRTAEGARCGLTQERLLPEQTLRICRDWTAPPSAAR